MVEFKNGNIISLNLKNFQTFSSQKFTFGPSLNYIAAPNGSGKSSIANAIAFVFNGTPKTIGKSKDIAEFIKFGNNESEIEAEIFYNNSIIKLRRSISLTHNHYFLNEKLVTQKDYFSFLKKIKVDVNNLCTFLPQERVGEFCRMNGQDLLSETLKSSEIDLRKVKEFYIERERIEQVLETQLKEKDLIAENLNLLQSNAIKFQEKETMLQRKIQLESKKLRIEFENLKVEYFEIKEKLLESKAKIEESEKKVQTFCKKVEEDEGREEYKDHKKNIEILVEQNKELSRLEERLKNKVLSLEMCKNEDEKIVEKIRIQEKEIVEHESKACGLADEYSSEKSKFKEEMVQFGNKVRKLIAKNSDYLESNCVDFAPRSLEEVESLVPSLRKLDSEIQNQGFQISQMHSVSSKIQKEVEELEVKKKSHSNLESIKLESFKKYHLDSYKAVLWLRDNKDKFKSEILEPSFLHISINKDFCAYVEAFLSYQAMTSFIAMNQDDFTLLARILKDQQNLAINISMYSNHYNERISQQDLSRFNFEGVVSDFITCRQEYLDFFNSLIYLNTIPISRNEIKEEAVYDSIPTIRRMGVNGRFSEIKKSRYDNDFVIITNKIKYKGILDFPSFDIKGVNDRISLLNHQRETNRATLNKIIEKKEALDLRRKMIKSECDFSGISKLHFNIENAKRNVQYLYDKIDELKNLNYGATLNDLRERMRDIGREVRGLATSIDSILDLKNIPSFDLEKIKSLKLDLDNTKRQLVYENHSKTVEEEVFVRFSKIKTDLRKRLEDLKAKIRSCSMQEMPNIDGSSQLPDLPDNLLEIQVELDSIESKLMFCKSEFDQNDYKRKESHLAEINENINTLTKQKERSEGSLENEKKMLENEINSFLLPIGTLFSAMFERFGFQGKLELNTQGLDWELKILVKFRDNEDLQQLSSYRQSGGEKSLTTVLFLLSLQQCQETAFRLVDEINQGMDQTNERIVFEIIKEIGMNSQFFVITPKMLDHMEFSPDSKAIIVFGGSGITKEIENYCRSVLK